MLANADRAEHAHPQKHARPARPKNETGRHVVARIGNAAERT